MYIFKWIHAYTWGEKLVALMAMNNETLIDFPNKLERELVEDFFDKCMLQVFTNLFASYLPRASLKFQLSIGFYTRKLVSANWDNVMCLGFDF